MPDPNTLSLEGRHHMLSRVPVKLLVWLRMVRRLKCVLGSPVPFLLGVQGGSHAPPKPAQVPCCHYLSLLVFWGQAVCLGHSSEFYYHQCAEWADDSHPWQALFVPLLFASSLPILRCSWWECSLHSCFPHHSALGSDLTQEWGGSW